MIVEEPVFNTGASAMLIHRDQTTRGKQKKQANEATLCNGRSRNSTSQDRKMALDGPFGGLLNPRPRDKMVDLSDEFRTI